MINMFSQMACICHLVFFFMSFPEPPMGISSVGSFPVQSGGSLIIFQFLSCRHLALNRVFFLLFLEAGMFYTWGSGHPPMFVFTLYVCTPLHIHTHARGVHTPICSPYSSLHLYDLIGFCMLWGCKGPLTCWIPPLYGGASPSVHTPHSFIGFPVHWHVLGIPVCYMGNISLVLGVWGCSPICWGFWGHQHMGCPYSYSCTFL